MIGKFSLTIEVGNDAVMNPDDIGVTLVKVAYKLRDESLPANAPHDGKILDINGNTVGSFSWRPE